jgi:hypothetical protein
LAYFSGSPFSGRYSRCFLRLGFGSNGTENRLEE